jgi:CubicO group peptidase (beta-lactamase class C family)
MMKSRVDTCNTIKETGDMIGRRFPLLILLLILLSIPERAHAQTGAIVEELRSAMLAQLSEQRIPGFSVAVVMNDQLVWSEGFGFADLESGMRATGSTIYRIGSVSKPVVGTALMQLVEQGKVDLDTELQTYVPEFPRKRWPITIRHLVTHTSGIRHYRGDEFASMQRYDDLESPLAIFSADPLLFEPGTRYSYTTYGFNLVANVVENVSGMPIAEYMSKYVYEPAWMNSTGLEDYSEIQHGRAKWYETDDTGRWINAPYVDLSNKYAGGGLTSTVEDLCRLHIAYAAGRMMKPETVEQMYTNQTLKDGSPNRYGLSWRVEMYELPDGRGVRRVSHTGGSVGANTNFMRFPDQGFAVAIIANHRAQLNRIAEEIIRAFFEAGVFGER